MQKRVKLLALLAVLLLLAVLVSFLVYPNLSSISQPSENDGLSDRQTYEVTSQELSFESEGNRIYGRALIPETDNLLPTMIFSHGFGGNYEQEALFQEYLASYGVAVYSFDFAGGTGYSPGQSEGDMTDMSVLTEVQNLKDALAEVKKQEFVDPTNIFLSGASQGGVVTSLVAKELENDIRGLILLYPAYSLFDDAHSRFDSVTAIPETYNLMGLTVGAKYFTDIWDIDIYDELSQIDKPVLMFHGTADALVSMSYIERAQEIFPNAQLTKLEGEAHSLSSDAQEGVASQAIDFIDKNKVN